MKMRREPLIAGILVHLSGQRKFLCRTHRDTRLYGNDAGILTDSKAPASIKDMRLRRVAKFELADSTLIHSRSSFSLRERKLCLFVSKLATVPALVHEARTRRPAGARRSSCEGDLRPGRWGLRLLSRGRANGRRGSCSCGGRLVAAAFGVLTKPLVRLTHAHEALQHSLTALLQQLEVCRCRSGSCVH